MRKTTQNIIFKGQYVKNESSVVQREIIYICELNYEKG
jgi:hypothetical protein